MICSAPAPRPSVLRQRITLVGVLARALMPCAIGFSLLQCADQSSVDPINDDLSPVKGMVISNPVVAPAGISGGLYSSRVASEVVYVSVEPYTFPNVSRVQIENRQRPLSGAVVVVINGGFDPVAIVADAGDTLDLTAWHDDGTKDPMVVKVPAKKPPSITRSAPPKGRTDVALNVVVSVIFSEPIDRTTLTTSSFQLLDDGKPVSGRVLIQGESWNIQFVPDQPLRPNTNYDIVVSRAVRDESGDPLDANFSSAFTTGTEPCQGSSAPPDCSPNVAGTNVVSGIVRELLADGSSRPVANATVGSWLSAIDGSGQLLESSVTDASGRYNIGPIANGSIRVHAIVPGTNQPCAAWSELTGKGASIDVQLVSVQNSSPEKDVAEPRLTGVVYTLVPANNGDPLLVIPLELQAQVYLESPSGFVAATTTSTLSGRYVVCNLPPGAATLVASRVGYTLFSESLVVGGQSRTRDIEMQRSK